MKLSKYWRRLASNLVGIVALVAAGSAVPGVASAAAHSSALAPTYLRADGQTTAVLLGEPVPTLAWTVNDSQRAEAQTAYQVRVDSASAEPGSRHVWDSGRVTSSNSTDVTYRGTALTSNQTYSWSVRTWNRQGDASAWSAPARFDSGLFSPSDWSAWWLQANDGALVRGAFDVTKPVARARLYFAAQGLLEPHLNGSLIAPNQVLDSSVTDYDKRVLYREFDVTKRITQGSNALAFMVETGQYTQRPKFVVQLNITYTDGSAATFGTDPTWKSAAGPVVGGDFYAGETYDARKAITGWDAAGFDDSSWAPAHAVAPVAHQQSIAQGKAVTALDTTTCCGWSTAALTDGVDGSHDSSQGYHSAIVSTSDSTKWVQVDLGAAQNLRQIRLFPARPTNDTAGDLVGAGFPVRYRVQVSDDPAFASSTTIVDHTDADQPNPGTASVDLPTNVTGRYVRVTATKLYCYGSICNLRLAELGIYGATSAPAYSAITQLEADPTPPTQIVSNIVPVKETRPGAGQRVYDFGQNYTGWVKIQAAQPSGTTVALKKGEILDANGHVTTSNISFSAGDVRQIDRYTFAGSGTEIYAPRFNYSGFRYAELTGLPEDATVTVTAQVEHTNVATTGEFSSSSAILNKIQGAVTQTQLNALQSIPVDCPTREKRGWLGDAADSDLEAMSNLDMQAFYTKWLGDIRTSAYPDNSLPSVAPAHGRTDWRTDPAWGTAYPQIAWDAYVEYGSTELIETNYSQIKAWVDYLGTISDSDHIVVNSPTTWGDDWVSIVGTPHQYFQTGFFYLDADLLAKMATVMGKSADAAHYSELADQIAAGFVKRYFDAETGVFATGTQLSYAMPLVLGIVPAGHEQATLDKLVQNIVANNNHVTTGFVGTTFVFQALGKYNRNDIALAIAQRTDYPSFGYMVNEGPGTIWEKWQNSSAPDGTSSKDHIGLGGSVGQWFYQQLGGIQPGTAAYRTFTLAPSVVGGLTDVTARQRTVRGTIVSSWHRDGAKLTYRASVPVGATATIKLPLLGGRGSTVREGGRTIVSNGHAGQPVPGLKVGQASDQVLTLTAGSGDYTFTVLPPRTPYTQLAVTATGDPAPVTPGNQADISALVAGRSTAGGSIRLSAQVPAGWTATESEIPLTPTNSATLATLKITVPESAASGTYPVQMTARAPDGTVVTSSINVIVFGKWPAETSVSASSAHAPNTVNGEIRTYDAANAIDGRLGTFWNDDTDGQFPDTLTVTTSSAVALSGVGFASFVDGVTTDFTVQTWDGQQWVTQAGVTGNFATYRWIPFPSPVTTNQVRVVVTGARNSFSRIAELTP